MRRELRVLLGAAESRRIGDRPPERFPRILGERGQQRRVEQARRDRDHPDPGAGEVAGRGQRHADHAALRRRVRDLPDLAVVGGDRGGVDANAALAVGERLIPEHLRRREAQHVERADEVD